jgi:hypothetical protein
MILHSLLNCLNVIFVLLFRKWYTQLWNQVRKKDEKSKKVSDCPCIRRISLYKGR